MRRWELLHRPWVQSIHKTNPRSDSYGLPEEFSGVLFSAVQTLVQCGQLNQRVDWDPRKVNGQGREKALSSDPLVPEDKQRQTVKAKKLE